MHRRHNILIIVLGLGLLFTITFIGSNLDSLLPQHPTAANQVVHSGPYQIALLVSPNPPHITDSANLTIQVVNSNTRQLITNATVVLEYNMVTMEDMGRDHTQAKLQDDGSYLAHVQFTMSGPWQVSVLITIPGAHTVNATFEVTAQ